MFLIEAPKRRGANQAFVESRTEKSKSKFKMSVT